MTRDGGRRIGKCRGPSRSNAVSITGNVANSAIIAGDHNQQYIGGETKSDEQAKVLESLPAIRRGLADLSGPYADHARKTIDQAIDTANKGESDKKSLGVLLEVTLQAAKKTAGFSSVAVELAPHLRHVAHWLGGEWGQLLTLI